MRSPTPFSDAIPTPQTPTYSPVTLFRAFLHPCPRSAHSLGGSANLISGIWEMKGKEKKKKDLRPGRAIVSRAALARSPARFAQCPQMARSGPGAAIPAPRSSGWARVRVGAGHGGGGGERGAPLPSSPPSPSPPPLLYIFFFLPSSLASLSPLESEGASRLGAGAGYVSQTVTCSLPVSFSCVLK